MSPSEYINLVLSGPQDSRTFVIWQHEKGCVKELHAIYVEGQIIGHGNIAYSGQESGRVGRND